MSNYEYANGTGLSVLSQQIFEHLTPLVESVKVFFLASYDRENPPKIGKYIENEDGNSIWATEDNSIFAMEPWSDTPPERLPGMYLWTYTEAIFKDGSVYNSDPVCMVTWDDIDNAVSGMTASLEAGLALKADKATTYTKTEVDTSLAAKSDKATTYTKSDVDAIVNTDVVASEAANPLILETESAQTAKSTIVKIEPIQDLHGYDRPWPAGGGKNKCYSSNFNGTVGNVTFVTNADGTVTCNGTASQDIIQIIGSFELLAGVSYKGNGCPSGGGSTTFSLFFDYIGNDTGTGTIEYTRDTSVNGSAKISIKSGYTCNNLTFKPMVRFSSVSDATFEPYSNICPISGLDEVKVERTGKNLAISGYPWNVNASGAIAYSELYNSCVVRVKKDKTYIHSINGNAAITPVIAFYTDYPELNSVSYNASRTVSGASTFTAPIDGYAVIRHDASDTNIQVELGSTATTYEPYQKFDAEVDLPTTIYGGTLNLETGELVCDKVSWSANTSSMNNIENYPGWTNCGIANIVGYGLNKTLRNMVGSIGTSVSVNTTNTGGTGTVFFTMEDYGKTQTEWKSLAVDVQFIFRLITPKTYHLTPAQLDLLKGTNVITVNGKTIQVTYREGSLATLEEVNEVSDSLTNEERTSPEGNPIAIETDAAQYAKNTHLTLEPVQDLHGYDHPWPAGGGKNLLPMTVAGIKALNTGGVWSGNTCTLYGVTFTILTDNGENVIGIKVNGTNSRTSQIGFRVCDNGNISAGTYVVSGSTGGSYSTFWLNTYNVTASTNIADSVTGGVSFTASDTITVRGTIYVAGSATVSNVIFYPMLRKFADSADFEPYSNICSITGVDEVEVRATGFNQWDEEWEAGLWNLTTGEKQNDASTIRCKNYISVFPNTTYCWNSPSTSSIRFCYYDENKNRVDSLGRDSVVSPVTFTTPERTRYMTFYVSSTAYNHDICINISDSEKNGIYEPYTESTASLDLPEEIYSGTLDLETGEVVADMGMVDLGTLNWTYQSQYTRFASSEISNAKLGSARTMPAISSKYIIISDGRPLSEVPDKSGYLSPYNNIFVFFVHDTSYTDATTFKTAMSGVQLCYELATPITYQLTPQQLALFKGINNISTNAKTVQVTYRNGELATTGNIVESTEVAKRSILGEAASDTDAKLATSLAPILGNFATAETSPTSASHAVGEYLLYNNRLYKVLAAISAGQQLTIGTNVGQTNVAAELASLNGMVKNIDVSVIWENSICDYADSISESTVRHVWYGANNPDAPSNTQGYCKIISKNSDTKILIAASLDGYVFTRYRYGTWQSNWLSV